MNHSARLLIAATLIFAAGCAKTDWIDRTLVTVDVTGRWEGATENYWVELVLEQQEGPRVKGSMQVKGAKIAGNTFSGLIDSDLTGDVFRFRDARGHLEGELTVSVSTDVLDGRVSFSGSSLPISLRRVDPSSPLAAPPK
jgi:hypothetical protein